MHTDDVAEHVELIRQAFGYITRFKGTTFVLKIENPVIDDPAFPLMVRDIALLHQLGIRVVIVPGTKERIDDVLTKYAIPWDTVGGVRVSSPEAIPFIKMAASDVANRIMTLLAQNETNAVIGNWVKARSIGVRDGVDFQSTGLVESVKVDIVHSVLDQALIPIFPNIGWSATGKPYNISSNELATVLATRLGSEKLFFVTPHGCVTAGDWRLPPETAAEQSGQISRMTDGEAAEFVELNAPASPSPLLELVSLAVRACRGGVPRVHILDGRTDGVLLKEIFSTLGLGTMVYANTYVNVRRMRSSDVPSALAIMAPLVRAGVLVARTAEQVEARIDDYYAYEIDGVVHACVALHSYGDTSAEVAALAVDPAYSSLNIGRRLVAYCIEEARKRRASRVFVLTTQTSDWFDSLGFTLGGIEDLPPEKRIAYDRSRNSRVLTFPLGAQSPLGG
jgi:amino-acid N-acetyltransferase